MAIREVCRASPQHGAQHHRAPTAARPSSLNAVISQDRDLRVSQPTGLALAVIDAEGTTSERGELCTSRQSLASQRRGTHSRRKGRESLPPASPATTDESAPIPPGQTQTIPVHSPPGRPSGKGSGPGAIALSIAFWIWRETAACPSAHLHHRAHAPTTAAFFDTRVRCMGA